MSSPLSDAALVRLLRALVDPAVVWEGKQRCPSCHRAYAEADCEPDINLCWSRVEDDPSCPG